MFSSYVCAVLDCIGIEGNLADPGLAGSIFIVHNTVISSNKSESCLEPDLAWWHARSFIDFGDDLAVQDKYLYAIHKDMPTNDVT